MSTISCSFCVANKVTNHAWIVLYFDFAHIIIQKKIKNTKIMFISHSVNHEVQDVKFGLIIFAIPTIFHF